MYVCIVLGIFQQRNKNWYYNRKGEELLKVYVLEQVRGSGEAVHK